MPPCSGAAEGGGPGLDPTDATILCHLARGRTFHETALSVSLSERTVRRRVRLFAHSVGASTTIEAVVHAVREQMI